MANSTVAAGCFTGRLQPIHNGHIELMLRVLANHELLIVAITNPDAESRIEDEAHPTRHLAESNPFNFDQRSAMVHAALTEARIDRSRYSIVPFPLHDAQRVGNYVPLDAMQYVRVFSPWEVRKVRLLAAYGYSVREVTSNIESRISGTDIRAAITSGSPWKHLVAGEVANLIEQYSDALFNDFGSSI